MENESEEIKVIDRRVGSESKEVVTTGSSPAELMRIALTHGESLEKIEKMLDLQKKYDENEARKAYFDAVAKFKENPPEVLKDKENSQFKGSKYVSLGNLLKTINPALGEFGLSVSFIPEQTEGMVRLTCKLSHRQGHSESVSMSAPPDTSGGNSKNPIQQIKSTFTYLRAMTFEAVTGLSAIEEANLDDDGNSAYSEDFISDEQVSELFKLVKETEMLEGAFLKSLKVNSLSELTETGYKKALGILKARQKQAK